LGAAHALIRVCAAPSERWQRIPYDAKAHILDRRWRHKYMPMHTLARIKEASLKA
jgi:hypothetical protein